MNIFEKRSFELIDFIKQVDPEYYALVADLIEHEVVRKMILYRQHYDTSTFEHCINVSYVSYQFCKNHGLDFRSMARAAILHDLFLYDWRKEQRTVEIDGLHAFAHPKIALKNACDLFSLNEKEKDIIVKHMWPVTLALPKYKESFVITFADKYCALQESWDHYLKAEHSFLKKKLGLNKRGGKKS